MYHWSNGDNLEVDRHCFENTLYSLHNSNHCPCLIPGYKASYFVSKPLDRLLFIHIYNKIGRAQGVSTGFASSIVWTKKISYGLQLYNPAY
jgi:hypothetical protein